MRSTYAQWLRYAAYTLLFMLVVVGGYYFIFVQQNVEQLSNDRLALLQESSDYFTEELGRVKENIDNTLGESAKVDSHSTLTSALEEITYVHGVRHDEDEKELWEQGGSCLKKAAKEPKLQITFDRSFHHPHFQFVFSVEDATASEDTTASCRLAAANPDSLLTPFLPQRGTAFDKVVLARRDGRVLTTSGTGSISIDWLPLPNQEPFGQEAAENSNGTEGLHSEIFTIEAAGISHRIFLQPFTVPIDIRYPGEDQKEEASTKEGEVLFLAGVKQEQAFQAEAQKLPPTLLWVLLGVVAVTLLAFPFLEIWFIGPTEPFQAHDIFEVAVGVVIASSIVIFALLSFFCYQQLKERQFEHLEELSKVIENTFRTEVKEADSQLRNLTKKFRECNSNENGKGCIKGKGILDGNSIEETDVYPEVETYPHLEMASWINRNGWQLAKWSVEEETTPLIKVSDRGYVRAHTATIEGPEPAPPRGQVWQHRENDSTEWVLESIRSKNTGEVFAQISQQIQSPDTVKGSAAGRDDSTAVVAAATLPLLSLIDPVLPPGYGFALIDDQGKVQFHSDTRRNLRENFFEKMIGGGYLRNAVFARRADKATAQYREVLYQFHSEPVKDTPWTLLVFAELQPIRAMHGHILTSAFGVYAGYLLVLFLLGLLPWMGWIALKGQHNFGLTGLFYSLWPDRRKEKTYRRLLRWEGGILMLSILLLGSTLGNVIPEVWQLAGMVGLALAALLLFCLYCGQEPPDTDVPARAENIWTWPNPYSLAIFLLVLIIGVLPPAVFYSILHDESTELLTKRNQRIFARQLVDRGNAWAEHYRGISLDKAARNTLDKQLFPKCSWEGGSESHLPWDVHTVQEIMTLKASEDCPELAKDTTEIAADATGAIEPVNKALSQYSITSKLAGGGHDLHVFSDSMSSDTAWSWRRSTGSDSLTYNMPSSRRAGLLPADSVAPAIQIDSSVPMVAGLITQDGTTFGLLMVLVGILAIVLWWAIRGLLSRIFFMRPMPVLKQSREEPSTDTTRLNGPLRCLFLRMRPKRDSTERSECYIDSAGLRREQTLDEITRIAEESAAQVIVVDNFHDGLGDVEVAETKRALLEKLVPLDKALEVYSDIDPLPYLRAHSHENSSTESAPIDLDAWATVLSNFRKRSSLLETGDECIKSLREHRSTLGLNDTQQVTERLESLAAECRADPYLRTQIGYAMAGDRQLETLPEEQIVEQVKYHAQAHYQHLWMTCSDKEKVILYRISTDGFVSPHSRDIVEHLLCRGLLVMDPVLRPMNQSFKRFVAEIDSSVIAQYEREASTTTWNQVRTPLLIAFATIVAFVFVTQPDIARETAALAPALATGLPVLINVISGLFGGRSGMQGEEGW